MIFNNFKTHYLKAVSDRWVEGVISAELVDKQGEVTVQKMLFEKLQKFLKSSASMQDSHTNHTIGKWTEFRMITITDKEGRDVYGIYGKGWLYKDNYFADRVWEKIQKEEYEGISFGGEGTDMPEMVMTKDGKRAFKLNGLEIAEVSLCPTPAVPWALITNYNTLAKSYTMDELNKLQLTHRRDEKLVLQCKDNHCYVNDVGDYAENISNYIKQKTDNNINMTESDIKKNETVKEEDPKKDDENYKDGKDKDKSVNLVFDRLEQLAEKMSAQTETSKSEVKTEKTAETLKKEDVEASIDAKIKAAIDPINERFTGIENGIATMTGILEKMGDGAGNRAPGKDIPNGSQTTMTQTYVDNETGTSDPKVADNEGTDDSIKVEEKSDNEVVKEVDTQNPKLNKSEVAFDGNFVIDKARKLGPEAMADGILNSYVLSDETGVLGKVHTALEKSSRIYYT